MYYPQVFYTCSYSLPAVGTKNGSYVVLFSALYVLSTSVLYLFIFNASGGHQKRQSRIHKCFKLVHIQFQWWAPKRPFFHTCLYPIPVVGTKNGRTFKLYRSNNMYYPQVFPTCSYSILLVGTKNGRPFILYRSYNMYYPQVFHTCSYASTVTSMFVFVCLTPVLHC